MNIFKEFVSEYGLIIIYTLLTAILCNLIRKQDLKEITS